MQIQFLKTMGNWLDVKNSARTTINLGDSLKEPSDKWKKKLLLSEHSPIRQIMIKWKWIDLKSWVSVHFTRHFMGISHFVSSQRTDRTGVDRDKKRQDSLVAHECIANLQSLINISQKRLCKLASKETQEAWKKVINVINDKVVVSVQVPSCIYRGHCYEVKSCGYDKTEDFKNKLINYRDLDNYNKFEFGEK